MEFDTKAHLMIIISFHMNMILNKKSNLSQTYGKLIEKPHLRCFLCYDICQDFQIELIWFNSLLFNKQVKFHEVSQSFEWFLEYIFTLQHIVT